jgi:hypothetical protein
MGYLHWEQFISQTRHVDVVFVHIYDQDQVFPVGR